MKRINNILIELYKDRKQLLFLSILFSLSFWLESFIPNSTDVIYASGGLIAVGVGLLVGGAMTASSAKKNRDLASGQADDARIREEEAAAILEKDKAAYRNMKFKDPYKDIQNPFEDLTVNLQQANFEKQMFQQQQSNIMQQLQGAAGASGIAALAQSMSNQGQLQAQRAAASIGQQERANQLTAAKGKSAQQMAQAGGKQLLQQMEMDRSATLLGVSAGSAGAAAAGLQQAYANQMAAGAAETQAWGSLAGSAISAGGSIKAADLGKVKPSCFAEGDEVEMFDGIMKAIELIKIGDEVKSIKDNKVVKGTVTNTLIHPTNDVVEVVKINGITAEPKHPVFVDNKWILIGELETTIYQFIDNWYNLEIDGNTGDSEHNYIIGNLVVSGSYPERTDSIVSTREKVINKKFKQV